jgi:hypothetical protein
MQNETTHIRLLNARVWMPLLAILLFIWQGILAVSRSRALTFLTHFVQLRNNCLTKKGIAAFLPSPKKDGWISAAVL